MDVENPMVVDKYWPDYDESEKESEWEKLCRKADEQYDEEVSECRN